MRFENAENLVNTINTRSFILVALNFFWNITSIAAGLTYHN